MCLRGTACMDSDSNGDRGVAGVLPRKEDCLSRGNARKALFGKPVAVSLLRASGTPGHARFPGAPSPRGTMMLMGTRGETLDALDPWPKAWLVV